jgi:hypothetical protein
MIPIIEAPLMGKKVFSLKKLYQKTRIFQEVEKHSIPIN